MNFTAELTLKKVRSLLHPIRHKWKDIAIELEISTGTIGSLKQQYSDPKDLVSEMVSEWLKGISPQPSWEILASALESDFVNEKAIAKDIRERFCDQFKSSVDHEDQISQLPHSSAMKAKPTSKSPTEEYAGYMRSIYSRSEFPDDNKWPPTPSKHFIDLAFINKKSEDELERAPFTHGIDQYVNSRESVDMKDIGRPQSDSDYPHIILVEGAPGVGKTTFAWQLCRKWASKELLKEYKLVIFLRLRDRKVRESKTLNELFYHYDGSLSEKVRKEVESEQGKGVMFILEGFDELPQDFKMDGSIFSFLLNGRILPSASILVTSRPRALTELRCKFSSVISQHIEILGFIQDQIFEFVDSLGTKSHVQDFIKFIIRNPLMLAIMYIPLNAAIVFQVYIDIVFREGTAGNFPTTFTDLYERFTLTLLLRYIGKCKKLSFNSLPPNVKISFAKLCQLAYEGLQKKQVTFHDLPDDFETLGFMQSYSDIHISRGICVSSSFLHFTLQEYLAARYIAENKDPADHFKKITLGYNDMYIRFLAGITQLQNSSHSKYIFNSTNPSIIMYQYICLDAEEQCTLKQEVFCDNSIERGCLNWWYESKNKSIITGIDREKSVAVHMPQVALDYYALGHCIAVSHCKWKLIIDKECMIKDECAMLMIEGLKTGDGESVIESIFFNTKSGMPRAFGDLLKFLASRNKLTGLHKLWIFQNSLLSSYSNSILKECPLQNITIMCKYGRVAEISTTLASRTLESLYFHPLSKREVLGCKYVQSLMMIGPCGFDGDIISAICELLSQENTIHTLTLQLFGTHIERFASSLCRFHRYNFKPVFEILKYNKTLKTLKLFYVNLTTSFNLLNSLLLRNQTLQEICLLKCGVSDDTLSNLSRIFTTGRISLQKFAVHDSFSDCKSILKMLHIKSSLKELTLRSDTFLQNVEQLMSALVPGIKLSTLEISYIQQKQYHQMQQHCRSLVLPLSINAYVDGNIIHHHSLTSYGISVEYNF